MRNQSDVNVHRTAYRQHERSNGARITFPRTLDAPEVRTPQYLDYFLPRKETRLMADEANRTGGLFLPYPLLGILMTLILALGGGIIGLYAQVSTMNATILMRDADHREQVRRMNEKLDQMEVYMHDGREKSAVMKRDVEELKERRRN